MPGPSDKIRVKILDFHLTEGSAVAYTLEDETIVKFSPQLNQVYVQIDEKGEPVLGPNGMPIYSFNFGVQTQVVPKNRTLYVSKPQSTTTTSPSTITV